MAHGIYRINELAEVHPAKLTATATGAVYRIELKHDGTESIELHLSHAELQGTADLVRIMERDGVNQIEAGEKIVAELCRKLEARGRR